MPKNFFTQSIHSPDLGRDCSSPENVARNRYGKPSPSESVNMDAKPKPASPRCARIASSATTNGPTHGAATMPTNRPDTNSPASDEVFAPPATLSTHVGGCIS